MDVQAKLNVSYFNDILLEIIDVKNSKFKKLTNLSTNNCFD